MAHTQPSTRARITVFASMLVFTISVVIGIEWHAWRWPVYGLLVAVLVLLTMPIDVARTTNSFEDQKKYESK